MQSDHDISGGGQANQMLQVILNKLNEQKSDIERTMAMQLEKFKEELRGATSSISSEVKKLKSDQGTIWKNSQLKITFPTLLLMILMMKSVATRLKIRRLERKRKKQKTKREAI